MRTPVPYALVPYAERYRRYQLLKLPPVTLRCEYCNRRYPRPLRKKLQICPACRLDFKKINSRLAYQRQKEREIARIDRANRKPVPLLW